MFRWELKAEMSRKEIAQVIKGSGLVGLTFGDDFVEAYYVGDPSDEQTVEAFRQGALRAGQSFGANVGSASRGHARLWPYGNGKGSIGYGAIRGVVPAGTGTTSKTAAQVAQYLAGTGSKVKVFDPKPADAERVALQARIAEVYEALPDNDLRNPVVKEAHQGLSKVLRQCRAPPQSS